MDLPVLFIIDTKKSEKIQKLRCIFNLPSSFISFLKIKNNKPLTSETNCGPALVDGLVVDGLVVDGLIVDVLRHLFFLEKRIVRSIYK